MIPIPGRDGGGNEDGSIVAVACDGTCGAAVVISPCGKAIVAANPGGKAVVAANPGGKAVVVANPGGKAVVAVNPGMIVCCCCCCCCCCGCAVAVSGTCMPGIVGIDGCMI